MCGVVCDPASVGCDKRSSSIMCRRMYGHQVPRLKPRLTVRGIRPLVSGLRKCGYDVAPILAAIGIDEATLENPDGWVPTSVAMTLLNYAVEQTGDGHLGLHLAETAELSS